MTAALASTEMSRAQRAEAAVSAVSTESDTVVAVVFAFKAFVAGLLALFLAFWLALDEPRWALLTVFVVSQPDSGLVVAKSFFRILGTIAGLLVSVLLVFTFAEPGELFLTSLAAWIAFCTFAAGATRNFTSYGFVLAGYTVALVGFPAALNPRFAYPLVIARFTEIILGIACAALVSRVIFPREIAPNLVGLVRELMCRAERFAAAATDPALDQRALVAERERLAADYAKIEGMRTSAYFESADARIVDGRLRRSVDAAIHASVVAEDLMANVGSTAVGASANPRNARQLIRDTDDTPCGNGAAVSALRRASEAKSLSQALSRLREGRAALDKGSTIAGPTAVRRLWSDPAPAALNAARCALAIAITSVFWMATAWPSGDIAVIVAAIVCGLFGSSEQPVKISLALVVTILVAAIPVFGTIFYLLPLTLDFPSMAAAVAPLLLASGFMIAQQPLGVLPAVYFTVVSNIDNVETYDPVAFLNTTLAILGGIGVALVLFATFFPETPTRIVRRFHRQLFAQLSRIAGVKPPPVEVCESALHERLATTLERLKNEPSAARSCVAGAMIALSIARAIDELRRAMDAGRLPRALAAGVSSLLGHTSSAYCYPRRADLAKCAWEARNVRRRSLAMARAASGEQDIEALAAVVVGCEALRSNLLKSLILLPETADVR